MVPENPMPPIRSPFLVAAALVLAATIGTFAVAQEPAAASPTPQRCRVFQLADLDKDRDLVTTDRSTEVGQWVAAREAEGLRMIGIDFEVGQKSTGYPQGYLHVCMGR